MARPRSFRRTMRSRKIKHRKYLASFTGWISHHDGMYATLTTNCGCKMCQDKSGKYRGKSSNMGILKTKRDKVRIAAMIEEMEECA